MCGIFVIMFAALFGRGAIYFSARVHSLGGKRIVFTEIARKSDRCAVHGDLLTVGVEASGIGFR